MTIPSAGPTANAPSLNPSVSGDGRFVAFESFASNLVSADTNAQRDIFVRDRLANTTTRVSVSSSDEPANGSSSFPMITPDGRFIAFESVASNLAGGDGNNVRDIFVRDTLLGQTRIASVSSASGPTENHSFHPSISADGRYVAFESESALLVAGDTNNATDVFLRDRLMGTTIRASHGMGFAQSNGASRRPSISADGAFVAFDSDATNLAPGTSGPNDVYLYEVATDAVIRVSAGQGGAPTNGSSLRPNLSSDAGFVVYDSEATNIVSAGLIGIPQVFLFDRIAGTTSIVSVVPDVTPIPANADARSAVISADGNVIAYWSVATNLVAGDTNGASDVFVFDRTANATTIASSGPGGLPSDANCLYPAISADGQTVVFQSFATNLLVGGDGNAYDDVYARDCVFADTSSFCSGDGSATACPCGNAGAPGHGCAHSTDADGARLSWSGNARVAADTVSLVATELPTMTLVLFFQGTTQQSGGAGIVFGDGLRCVAGTIKRLGTSSSTAGVAATGAGVAGTNLIHVVGVIPPAGGTRFYQAWYRNSAAFCTSSNFNLSNAVRIDWLP